MRMLYRAYLPKKLETKILDAQSSAASVFERLDDVIETKILVDKATLAYSKIHGEVRVIQRDVRKIEKKIKRLEREAQISDDQDLIDHIKDEINKAQSDIKKLKGLVPIEWDVISGEYQEKLKALAKVERKYRGAMDDSFSGIEESINII